MKPTDSQAPRRRDLLRRFGRAAARFDGADVVHRHTAAGLLERLAPIELDARHVLDLGCATGGLGRELARHFRRSRIYSLDLCAPMLAEARRRRSRFSRLREVRADAVALPFGTGTLDAVVSNQLLPWLPQPGRAFVEVARVLRVEGLFAFATLGPDSLRELRDAFGDEDGHVLRFADMHEVGDALVRAGLRDPVLDVDALTLTYPDCAALYRDLGAVGARNSLAARRRTLTGKGRLAEAEERLRDTAGDGRIAVTLELVYGHAWGGGPRPDAGEYRVDAASLRGSRRQM